MQCTILANGEYAPLFNYRSIVDNSSLLICADGGANYAYQMEIVPHYIVGDLDSISPKALEYYTKLEVPFYRYPKRKDFTDMQLALAIAESKGANHIYFLGSLGGRLDHTLSNLYWP
jgi:thiamine pyrophosphokinase